MQPAEAGAAAEARRYAAAARGRGIQRSGWQIGEEIAAVAVTAAAVDVGSVRRGIAGGFGGIAAAETAEAAAVGGGGEG